MLGSKKSKGTVVKTLKTSRDFTELLSLSELDIQMEVLGFLQENLFDYQMNYLKSFLKTFDEVIEYIPENDYPIYFNSKETGTIWENKIRVWEYPKEQSLKNGIYQEPIFMGINSVISYYKDKSIKNPIVVYDVNTGRKQRKESIKESIDSTNLFIIDTDAKKLYRVNKKLIPNFKFSKKKKTLVCSSKFKEIDGYEAPFNKGYHSTDFYEFTITISLAKNSVISVETLKKGSKSVYVGWGSNARDIEKETIYGE